MAIGDTYPGDPVGRRTLSRVPPSATQETQAASWTAPWKDLWDDSLTKKAATGIMNVARDVGSNYKEDLQLTGEHTVDAIKNLGQGYSDWYNKKYPGGLSDLGKDIITEMTNIAAAPADTALALASGMATSVYAPLAAVPTLLGSDAPFTREGSEEWRDKMHSVAANFPTYHAQTPVGKGVTEFVGSAWEIWNEQVAARAGRGIENILKSVGVDYKNAERAGAATAGVVAAAPVVAPSVLRVRGESTSLPVGGYDRTSIRNARINSLANIADPNVMARIWMQADPVGFARAKADGTLNKKLSNMGWEFNDHIENIPILKEELGTWKKNEASGDWEYHSEGLGEFRPAGKYDIPGAPEEIALDPTAIDLAKSDTGTAGHELDHALTRHAYKELVPETKYSYSQWRDDQGLKGRQYPSDNRAAAQEMVDEYSRYREQNMKRQHGYLSEEIPSVKKLSEEILDQETQNIVSSRQAEVAGTLLGEESSGWDPPPPGGMNPKYWSYEIWVKGIRDELKNRAEPLEISARLDGLQRFLKVNDLGVSDIFTKYEYVEPGNRLDTGTGLKEVTNPKLKRAPSDVNQLIVYLNNLVAAKYNKLQRADVISQPTLSQLIREQGRGSEGWNKARHHERIGAATKYAMDMLTEALADTKITFPTRYKVGLVGR